MAKSGLLGSFILNQSNLQDFIECPRRFQLRVVEEQSWPAAASTPIDSSERSLLLGNRFHQACHQFFLGIPPSKIIQTLSDPVLIEMFDAFVDYGKTLINQPHFSEQMLQLSFGNHVLNAKFDLIVEQNDQIWIVDWKTSPLKPPLSQLSDRVQTYLYPYIFAQSGSGLFGQDNILPENIFLSYWYPLSSDPAVIFQYSSDQHDQVKKRLGLLLDEIDKYLISNDKFPLTDDQEKCQYCPFRSLCDRGVEAGLFSPSFTPEDNDSLDFRIDMDQISEIEF